MDIDPISPKYYDRGGIATIRFITAHGMSSLEGSIVKYVDRYKFKNGLEDLLKARWCLNALIKEVRRNEHSGQKIQVRKRVPNVPRTYEGDTGPDLDKKDMGPDTVQK